MGNLPGTARTLLPPARLPGAAAEGPSLFFGEGWGRARARRSRPGPNALPLPTAPGVSQPRNTRPLCSPPPPLTLAQPTLPLPLSTSAPSLVIPTLTLCARAPTQVRELGHSSVVVRQKSLVAARELLVVSQCRVQCIMAGGIPALVTLLSDEDVVVRERAAQALQLVGVNTPGCVHLLSERAITKLVGMLCDPDAVVRSAVFRALLEAAHSAIVRAELLSSIDTVLQLMRSAKEEDGDRVDLALQLLRSVLLGRQQEAAVEALVADGAIEACVDLLWSSVDPKAQEGAAWVLHLLTVPEDGKARAVASGGVQNLAKLLSSSHGGVVKASSAALMAITVSAQSKNLAAECASDPEVYGALLDSGDDELLMNVLQVVSNICENAGGRRRLQPLQPRLERMLEARGGVADVDRLSGHLGQTLRQLLFETLPYRELPAAQA